MTSGHGVPAPPSSFEHDILHKHLSREHHNIHVVLSRVRDYHSTETDLAKVSRNIMFT